MKLEGWKKNLEIKFIGWKEKNGKSWDVWEPKDIPYLTMIKVMKEYIPDFLISM